MQPAMDGPRWWGSLKRFCEVPGITQAWGGGLLSHKGETVRVTEGITSSPKTNRLGTLAHVEVRPHGQPGPLANAVEVA